MGFNSFAATIDVNEDTLYEWVKNQPDFSEAKKLGRAKSMLVWESLGIHGMRHGGESRVVSEIPITQKIKNEQGKIEIVPVYDNKGNVLTAKKYGRSDFNASIWIFNMKNRFGWRDKLEIDQLEEADELEFIDDE